MNRSLQVYRNKEFGRPKRKGREDRVYYRRSVSGGGAAKEIKTKVNAESICLIRFGCVPSRNERVERRRRDVFVALTVPAFYVIYRGNRQERSLDGSNPLAIT